MDPQAAHKLCPGGKHSSGNSKEQNGNAAWTLSTQVVLDFDTCGWMERVTRAFVLVCSRLTKPLSFADCVGDELPWGWEAGFDPQIGAWKIPWTEPGRLQSMGSPRVGHD